MADTYNQNMATQAEWKALQNQPPAAIAPMRDPLNAGHLKRRAISTAESSAQVLFGRVLDTAASLHCYRVALEGGRTVMPCVYGVHTGLVPYGAKEINSLPTNCPVWVLVHPQLDYGVILCVQPEPATDATRCLAGWIHRASRCGTQIDRHQNAMADTAEGSLTNWNSNRPADTTSGEWGAITETGLRVTLDSFMAQLAVDEATGVFAFYHDQLLRLAGVNFQEFSAGHEREILDDEGEIQAYHGFATYPWEAIGGLEPGQDPLIEKSVEEVCIEPGHFASLEPKHDDQQAFHRCVVMNGYVGQGQKLIIQAPPSSGSEFRYDDAKPVGLLEVQHGLDGSYSLRSAKSIVLAKRPIIPVAKRRRRADDPQGDTDEDYKASGHWGEGDDHKVRDRPETNGDQPHLQQAAALFDVHAHLFNWKNLHALHYHEKDFVLAEEEENGELSRLEPISFGTLASADTLPRPQAVKIHVDHRYGDVDIFPNESILSMQDDGSVVIGDGYGAEIRMVGGRIHISAPGDIFLQSGRNVVSLAGHDFIAKAKYSADITTTTNDVRIQARRNLQMVSGVDGVGATLIENKAASTYQYKDKVGEDVTSGGIQIKAGKGDVVTWSKNLYLRTGGGDVEAGHINLDAAKGQNDIITHSRRFSRFLTSRAEDFFGQEQTQKANIFSQDYNMLAAGVLIDGYAMIDGVVVNRGGLVVLEGQVGTELDPPAGVMKGDGLQQARTELNKINENQTQEVKTGVDLKKAYYDKFWYADEQAGHDDVISAAKFTHRTQDQFLTGDFSLFESRWQQMARKAGFTTSWDEQPLPETPSEGGYPYPGEDKITGNSYYRQDLNLFDLASGHAKSRSASREEYEEPKLADPEGVAFNSNYLVTV